MIGFIQIVKNPKAMEWSDVGQMFSGAALWQGVRSLYKAVKEERRKDKEEDRKEDIHTFEQLKIFTLTLNERLKEESQRVNELLDKVQELLDKVQIQDDVILGLKQTINSKTLEISTLLSEKKELEKKIEDLEKRLAAAVASGAGIAAKLERDLQWYKSELVRIVELYEQATGKTSLARKVPFPESPLDAKEQEIALKLKEDEIAHKLIGDSNAET